MKTTTENRVRRIIIRKSDSRYAPLRALTLSSAKLWNVALDRTRSSYQVNGKTTTFGQLDKELISESNEVIERFLPRYRRWYSGTIMPPWSPSLSCWLLRELEDTRGGLIFQEWANEHAGRPVTFTKQAVNKWGRDTSFKIGLPADKVELDAGIPHADVQFVRVIPREWAPRC